LSYPVRSSYSRLPHPEGFHCETTEMIIGSKMPAVRISHCLGQTPSSKATCLLTLYERKTVEVVQRELNESQSKLFERT
jgi:hypothetical protein